MPVENSPRLPVDRVTALPAPTAAVGARIRWFRLCAATLWCAFAVLCAGEVVLRLASRAGILFFDVEMWRYAREMKRPSATPGVVLEHRPNVAGTFMGVRLRVDARGFRRAAPDIEAARNGSEPIVAVVGDSCTLGWGVPEGATVGEDLERLLNASGIGRFTVVNASVGNSNTAMEYARYLRDVRPLHPAWVILGYFINDAEPDPSPTASPVLAHSILLAMLTTRVPALWAPHGDYRSYYAGLYAPESAGFERFRATLAAFGAAIQEDGAMGTLLLIPEMHEPRRFGPFADIYRRVAALGAANRFDVVDPSEDFAQGPGERYWVARDDSHPNGAAQALLAAALARSAPARRLAAARP